MGRQASLKHIIPMRLSDNKITIPLFFVMLVSIGILVSNIHRPNLYQPGRGAILEAVTLIRETYAEEQSLQSKFRRIQQTLKEVVDYLDEAEKLDPEDKEKFEILKKELMALDEYNINLSNASSGHRSKYDKIIENLKALLDKAEDGAQ